MSRQANDEGDDDVDGLSKSSCSFKSVARSLGGMDDDGGGCCPLLLSVVEVDVEKNRVVDEAFEFRKVGYLPRPLHSSL